MTETPSNERRQYCALGVVSLAAGGLTAILSLSRGSGTFFEPYFGSIPPLRAIVLVTLVGVVSLSFLHSRGWFEIYATNSLRGMGLSAAIATLFAIWQVIADLINRFPKDMNVPLPQSLLFYPGMAWVVVCIFHTLALAVLLGGLGPLFKKLNTNILIWPCIVLVSTLEPVLVHLRLGSSAYVGLFVFAFNLVQLYLFRRYDFVSMYTLRLVYYIEWHITWGYLRLQWLF